MKFHVWAGATALAGSMLLVAPAFGQAAPNVANPAQPAPQTGEQATEQQTAQTDADGTKENDGTIVVTGSRIPRPETDGVLPGVQINAAQIQSRGFTNALEALNDTPLVGPGASPLNGNNGGQAASLGAAFVDLLDLGTQRTLTLVNGRRFVSGNAASLFVEGNATGAQVDVNVIPSSLIQRIDVVTVGGAAAYGADAVAGVVNYILKDDYEGTEVRGLSGISSRGDAAQYQINTLVGRNFMDGRLNITLAGEYTRNDGLQADSRAFRLARTASYTNPFNGSVRNSTFSPNGTIVDVTNSNNGAFLRNSDDLQPASAFGAGFVNQGLSFNGTVLNSLVAASALPTPYTPIASGTTRSNFITFANGLSPVGVRIAATTAAGAATTIATANAGFFSGANQIIQGTPGAAYISGNGLNGRTTTATNLPITTFAPTALPTGVTAAQVFAQFGVTAPTGATATQLNTLAINVLQQNRPTAREFFAANPNLNPNYFIGTFVPGVPRIANTDTTLVTVRSNATGGTVQVPVNQVLPFVSVPIEFNPDGSLRNYTFTSGLTPTSPLTVGQAQGSDGGFRRSIENIVLRTQQDRYVANLMGKYDVNDELTVFTENTYANVRNVSLRNSPSQNFLSNTAENAPLLLNVNNPYLTAQDRSVLSSVGVTSTAANGGNFVVTRQNQDIFGDNSYTNTAETYRLLGGVRSKFKLLDHDWTAELSGTYGHGRQITRNTQIKDIEYQLALDSVLDPATGTIRCRAQLFPNQYLGRTPIGTTFNVVRQPGADGLPTESFYTPTITQDQINACQPLNPFGYNNMSEASKAYVRQDVIFKNISKQTFLQATFSGALFDLPAGPLSFSGAVDYRKDELRFSSDALNQLGRGRAAPSSNFGGSTTTYEVGGEARVPLTGPDFLPFLGSLEFSPAIRLTQQDGSADSYRNRAGTVINPRSNGNAYTIYSLAGTWRPIRDILFRGNYTRSVRQPSVTELFLGGQPVFSTPTDYCSTANIDQGSQRVNRRNNCRAAAIASGNATDTNTADAFLANTFVPLGVGLQGTYDGTPTLKPERGKSWTAGGVLTPRFIPGLTLSTDYIDLKLTDQIVPTSLAQAIMTCYDSPTYPDTTAQLGTNTCANFSRGADFQIANGYSLGFLNLGSIQIRALNMSGSYPIELGSAGRLTFRANAYHLIRYDTSASGDFTDRQRTAGTVLRPKWETQLNTRYDNGGFFTQITWNWQNKTRIFSSGLPATIEQYPYFTYAATSRFDFVIGADVNDRFRIQFNVNNLTDKNTYGDLGYQFQDYVDQVGRRFQISAVTKL
jgi:outer membrane receptor protein involved in Fe transport